MTFVFQILQVNDVDFENIDHAQARRGFCFRTDSAILKLGVFHLLCVRIVGGEALIGDWVKCAILANSAT